MAEITLDQAGKIFRLAQILQNLEAPNRNKKKQDEDRAALLERTRLIVGERAASRKPDTTAKTSALTSAGRAAKTTAAGLAGVDVNNAEELTEALATIARQNAPEFEIIMALVPELLASGKPQDAAFAQGLLDSVRPPSPEDLENRIASAEGEKRITEKGKVGGFSVTGGPRSGFSARGTPAEILAELIATRPPELQAKFGLNTNTQPQPTAPEFPPVFGGGGQFGSGGGGASFGPANVPFPGLPPEAAPQIGEEPDILMQLFQLLSGLGAGAGTAPTQLGA